MSYRKWGKCEECGFSFNVSIGHPEDWNIWAADEEDMTPIQAWWWDNIKLCTACEKPFGAEAHGWVRETKEGRSEKRQDKHLPYPCPSCKTEIRCFCSQCDDGAGFRPRIDSDPAAKRKRCPYCNVWSTDNEWYDIYTKDFIL